MSERPPHDAGFVIITAEEYRCQVEVNTARDKLDELLRRVEDHALAVDLDLAATDAANAEMRAAHARLCRLRPDLADLFVLALFPWDVPLPADLGPGGRPELATEPSTVLRRWYGRE